MQGGHHQTFDVSFAQQRLWFLDQYEPNSSWYNIPLAWHIRGKLNEKALANSINEIISRHESLRTTFMSKDGFPMQVIADQLKLPLKMIDLTNHKRAEINAHWLMQEEVKRPFNLSKGPLVRAILIKLNEETHIFTLTLHHIITDGWSMRLLIRELSAIYAAFNLNEKSSLLEPLIQYADFTLWQRQWLESDILKHQLAYWRRTLEGAIFKLELPTDRPRPKVLKRHGNVSILELGKEINGGLRKLSQQTQSTLFMVSIAVFNILLYQYSHQTDICLGYPIANRALPEVENVVGLFVNTLVLRTQLRPMEHFDELLNRVRESVLDADENQDVPFEKLVEDLRPTRSLNHSPIFQVMFALSHVNSKVEGEFLILHELDVIPIACKTNTAKFDLSVELVFNNDCLYTVFEYDIDLFDSDTIEIMAVNYKTLLEAVIDNPKIKIENLSSIIKVKSVE